MRKEDPFTIFEILYKPVSVPKRELVRKFVSMFEFLFFLFIFIILETPEEDCQS